MNKYTALGIEVDKEVQKQLDIVAEEINKEIKNVKSMIVYGGFGRGEGSVKKTNNKYYPANDFDVYVITEKKVDGELLDNIARNVAKRLGSKGIEFNKFDKNWSFEDNFYLDLKCLTLDELKKLVPMIRYYELRNSSNIFYGEEVRNLIPDYKLNDIPLGEGFRVLLNRMTHLIEYFSTEGKYNDAVLSFFCAKAYIDSCTALLLLNKKYSPFYKKRMEEFYECYENDFPDLYKKLPDLHEKVKKYTLWKLNYNGLPEKDVIKFWMQTRKDFLEVVKYFMSEFTNKEIKNIGDLSDAIINLGKEHYLPYSRHFLKNSFNINSRALAFITSKLIPFRFKQLYFSRLLKEKKIYPRILINKRSPDVVIFGAAPHILFGLNEDLTLDKENFMNGLKTLRKVYPTKAKTWEELSQDYANAYILFYLMKIV
ncbi:hypothetical protein J4449_01345 [Candidatus Woesearchaeota archaeon]|nr:hypothetical protein [Candidatus Woesearchaeota archaeon]